jgi:glutathione-regulated potassium-efflux system ancillary protein KefG
MASSILLLFAHPAFHRSRANRRLVDAVQDLPGVTFRDLYEDYPDFNVDVDREQQYLVDHDIVVFQHPFYWYSAPALLKEWQDLVLEYGFAYGRDGGRLHGKHLLSAVTTGAGAAAYCRDGSNYYSMHELLAPFHQVARFCGMRWLPPFVVHDTLQSGDAAFREAAEDYRAILEGLRDGTLDVDSLPPGALLTEALPQRTPAGGADDAR